MNRRVIVLLLLTCPYIALSQKHLSAKEIYDRGTITNIHDWYGLRVNLKKDLDTVWYKYDNALFAVRRYYDYRKEKKQLMGIQFFYNHIQEGRLLCYLPDGSKLSENHYAHGEENGLSLIYNDLGGINNKIMYKDGVAIYEVKYNRDGTIKDSVTISASRKTSLDSFSDQMRKIRPDWP